MNMKKIIASTVAAALAVGSMAVFASAEDTYKAGIIFQTGDWNYRDSIDQDDMGVAGEMSEDYDTHEFNDVEITKDGSYTVSLKNLPESGSTFNFIKLSTTIPCANDDDGNVVSDVKVEITEVKLDGAAVAVDAAKVVNENAKEHLDVCLINEWNDAMKGNGAIENKIASEIEITFTVSGMGGSASADETTADETQEPSTGDTPKDPVNTGIEGVAVVAGLAVLATGAIVIAKKRK